MRQFYYHEPDDHEPGLGFELVVLGVIIGIWWLIVHFLDWLTFDAISWWIEPFTVLLIIPVLVMCAEYGANPLNWWPLVWGTKVKVEGNDFMSVWRKEEAFLKYGGARNVYWTNDYIKFRRRKDAVTFCLLQKFPEYL